jgi:hypothetical protein
MNDIKYRYKYLKYKYKYNKLQKQIGGGSDFNYYGKREGENLMERLVYQCPIFTTHNTFICKKKNRFINNGFIKRSCIRRR